MIGLNSTEELMVSEVMIIPIINKYAHQVNQMGVKYIDEIAMQFCWHDWMLQYV